MLQKMKNVLLFVLHNEKYPIFYVQKLIFFVYLIMLIMQKMCFGHCAVNIRLYYCSYFNDIVEKYVVSQPPGRK